MATCIYSSRYCLPPFYTIPIFPLLNRKIFHLLVSFLFLLHTAYKILCSEEYIYYCLRLFIVVYTLFVFMSCCWNCVMYVCQLSLLIWAGYRHFKERLPESICCCLQTCNVDVVLLVMYCMYMPAFIVIDISQLWVYLCYSLIYCLRLFVVVYKLVMRG